MQAPAADTLERLVPAELAPEDLTGRATLALHEERYRFARSHLRPGRTLDLACGVGYGCEILAERTDVRVVGVDVSEHAIAYARRHHPGSRIEYRTSDAFSFTDPEGFDTIVSLETLEHVADPGGLVSRFAAMLRPGGRLVASVPTTPSVDLNPHHRHDFDERSFRRLLNACAPSLREIALLQQTQDVSIGRVLARRERRMRDLRPALARYYLRHPGAFARRVHATLRYGFCNRYSTLVLEKPEGCPP